MRNSRFEEDFEKKRKFFKRVFVAMFIICILAVMGQLVLVYVGYTKIEENGGFRQTAIDLLREANKIQKEAEVK